MNHRKRFLFWERIALRGDMSETLSARNEAVTRAQVESEENRKVAGCWPPYTPHV